MTQAIEATAGLGDILATDGTQEIVTDSRPAQSSSSYPSTPITTADAALNFEEAHRVRLVAMFGAITCAVIAIGLEFIGGDPFAASVHRIGLLGALAVSVVYIVALRDVSRYRPYHSTALGVIAALTTGTGLYFWGMFSGAIIVLPAAALVLSQSRQRYPLMIVGGLFLLMHASMTLMIALDVMQDRGFNQMGDHPLQAQMVRLGIVQLIMIAGFAVAMSIRRKTEESLMQLDQALRALAQRDALLAEADRDRHELLQVGVPGRYTGERVGSYQLELVIGRGAHGVVYAARHADTDEPAAVKLLHPHVLANPEQFRRFLRELKIAKSLIGPNVVRVFEVPNEDDRFPYMAMERLRGSSLADLLVERGGKLEPEEVVEMVRDVGRGLAIAHRAGIVHRDLKPANVFRIDGAGPGARWKILDFGTSKQHAVGATVTQLGHVMGTPAYMAPEQARAARVDNRADVYGLAAVAYRALTGRPPFSQRELPRLLHDVAYAMPPRPSAMTTVHRDVDRVFAIAMAKKPYERFDSAAEFAKSLEAAVAGELDVEARRTAHNLEQVREWGSPTATLTELEPVR